MKKKEHADFEAFKITFYRNFVLFMVLFNMMNFFKMVYTSE